MNAYVIANWPGKHLDPLILRAGEGVTLGQRDTEWPGWIWCVNGAGQRVNGWAWRTNAKRESGWVPERNLALKES